MNGVRSAPVSDTLIAMTETLRAGVGDSTEGCRPGREAASILRTMFPVWSTKLRFQPACQHDLRQVLGLKRLQSCPLLTVAAERWVANLMALVCSTFSTLLTANHIRRVAAHLGCVLFNDKSRTSRGAGKVLSMAWMLLQEKFSLKSIVQHCCCHKCSLA